MVAKVRGNVPDAQSLARREVMVPLIAETGGQNALIVDSSALPEQVVIDAVTSAFNSAGQRCSALRVLFLSYMALAVLAVVVRPAARTAISPEPPA